MSQQCLHKMFYNMLNAVMTLVWVLADVQPLREQAWQNGGPDVTYPCKP